MSVIIFDMRRCKNKAFEESKSTISNFGQHDVDGSIIPRQAIMFSDIFIVTDKRLFKVLKSRIYSINEGLYDIESLPRVMDKIREYQEIEI